MKKYNRKEFDKILKQRNFVFRDESDVEKIKENRTKNKNKIKKGEEIIGNFENVIFIQTYNRPFLLLNTLKQIKYYIKEEIDTTFIHIINDFSNFDYKHIETYLKTNFKNFKYEINEKNYGKAFYYKSLNKHYNYIKNFNFKYYYHIPDDCILVENFFEKSKKIWNGIKDLKKISLNLILDKQRIDLSCWTNINPKKVKFGDIEVFNSGWVDMAFISNKNFILNLKEISLNDIIQMKNKNKKIGSGVGSYISKKLLKNGFNMYKVCDTILFLIPCYRRMNSNIEDKHDSLLINNKLNCKLLGSKSHEYFSLFYSNDDDIDEKIIFKDEILIYKYNENSGKIKNKDEFFKFLKK